MRNTIKLSLIAIVLNGCGSATNVNVPEYVHGAKYNQQQIDIDILDLINMKRSETQTCGNVKMSAVAPIAIDVVVAQYAADWASTRTLEDAGHGDFPQRASVIREDINDIHNVWWRAIGENNAVGQESAIEVVNAWMNSPKHCENIMAPHWNNVGIATINIGTPRQPLLSFSTMFVGEKR